MNRVTFTVDSLSLNTADPLPFSAQRFIQAITNTLEKPEEEAEDQTRSSENRSSVLDTTLTVSAFNQTARDFGTRTMGSASTFRGYNTYRNSNTRCSSLNHLTDTINGDNGDSSHSTMDGQNLLYSVRVKHC